MSIMKTSSSEITQAVSILHAGGLVAFPTETVYGLGADAKNEAAIRKIFAAKKRPFDHPLIVHIGNIEQLDDWAQDISPHAMKLARAFWPGPLTLILKKQPQVLDIVTGGQDAIGLRIPRHPIAQALLQVFGSGIAAPSANQFTHVSPTTADAVREELGDTVDLVLDGGVCEVGLESTIVDMSDDMPRILRPGMITAEQIQSVLRCEVLATRQDTPLPRAPGMHHLHYAPATKTILIATNDIPGFLQQLTLQDLPMAFLIQSNIPKKIGVQWVNMPQDPAPYAHDLYHTLRSLDKQHLKSIVIEMVPDDSEWEAIRDRLVKASGSLPLR